MRPVWNRKLAWVRHRANGIYDYQDFSSPPKIFRDNRAVNQPAYVRDRQAQRRCYNSMSYRSSLAVARVGGGDLRYNRTEILTAEAGPRSKGPRGSSQGLRGRSRPVIRWYLRLIHKTYELMGREPAQAVNAFQNRVGCRDPKGLANAMLVELRLRGYRHSAKSKPYW